MTTTEPTREVLRRPLPELPLSADGVPTDQNDVATWCQAAVELINDLRSRVVEMSHETEGGADAFNRLVGLGNRAAENIVSNAHQEAQRIVASAQAQVDGENVVPVTAAAAATAESFREEWERDASIEERVADRAFFDDGFDEPSRTWILADTA